MSCGRSGSGNSFCGRTGKVAGNAGTGYSSDSGGSADGRICIFVRLSEQHCDYFIILKEMRRLWRICQCDHRNGMYSGGSYHDDYLFIFRTVREKNEKSEGVLLQAPLFFDVENRLGILRKTADKNS